VSRAPPARMEILTAISRSATNYNNALSSCCFGPTVTSRDLVRYNHVKGNST
jgi:hypothetical protein